MRMAQRSVQPPRRDWPTGGVLHRQIQMAAPVLPLFNPEHIVSLDQRTAIVTLLAPEVEAVRERVPLFGGGGGGPNENAFVSFAFGGSGGCGTPAPQPEVPVVPQALAPVFPQVPLSALVSPQPVLSALAPPQLLLSAAVSAVPSICFASVLPHAVLLSAALDARLRATCLRLDTEPPSRASAHRSKRLYSLLTLTWSSSHAPLCFTCRVQPCIRRISPPARRVSPFARRVSPPARRGSPPAR